MTTADPIGGPHPEDLLIPYALDTLSEDGALEVEAHLDGCLTCQTEVASLREATAWLSGSVAARTPPADLLPRLMAALGRRESQLPEPAPAAAAQYAPRPAPWFRSAKLLVPMAAALVLLLAASVAVNMRLSGQIDRLTEEQANLVARLLNMAPNDTRLVGYLKQSEVASYLMENPSNEPLMLVPPGEDGDPQGVLLFAEDSRHGVLLIANMAHPEPPASYQVWLWRPDQRVRMGEVWVNSLGWGEMPLYYPPESVLRFEKVFLRKSGPDTNGAEPGDMVLEGSISALKSGD